MKLPEEFLHFIWQFRLYGNQRLRLASGEELLVIETGIPNKNAGPDFSRAKLLIGNTTWVGHVEIHIKSSDWLMHRHQLDDAYENVILHVVYEDDTPVYRRDGTLLPVLRLKGLFETKLLENYQQLIGSVNRFPCEKQIAQVDEFLVNGFLSRVLVERLEDKSTMVYATVAALKGDWDETFYRLLARNFGFNVNAIPMELLAQSLPQNLLARYKDQPLQIEALIFGQAGLLNQTFGEAYPAQLKTAYLFLQKKHRLTPIDSSLWKFMRMRPQNFPTLRLAQFAALIIRSNHLFSKILAIKDHQSIQQLFEELPVNPFWKTHYHFNKKAKKVSLQLGRSSVDNLAINTISRGLFAYGKAMDQPHLLTRAFSLLEHTPAEQNAVIDLYRRAGLEIHTAFNSQALLQLKKTYCNEKKCLNCGIGIKILKK